MVCASDVCTRVMCVWMCGVMCVVCTLSDVCGVH